MSRRNRRSKKSTKSQKKGYSGGEVRVVQSLDYSTPENRYGGRMTVSTNDNSTDRPPIDKIVAEVCSETIKGVANKGDTVLVGKGECGDGYYFCTNKEEALAVIDFIKKSYDID